MNNLRQARIRAGLSQGELAGKVNVAQPTISNWERGKGQPSEAQKKLLETILGPTGSGAISDASPLAAWLAKARLQKNWSVPELADHAGLTPAAIYRIESGVTRNLRDATRKKLEDALGSQISSDAVEELAAEANVQGLGSLEDFDPHSKDDHDLPGGPGIYVLYDISERPIYIGEGGNVGKRIKDHREKFWFKQPIVETAKWIKVDDAVLRKQIETLLIKFLKSNAVINRHNVDRD